METAAACGTLGDVYGLPGEDSLERDAEAINSYRQQIALSERALKINPNYGAARRTEAIGEYKIANMLLEKDPAVAIAGYQRALADIAMMPAQAQSAAPTLRLVYLLEAHMGRAYAVQGKMKDAITTIQRAHDEVAEIVANDPLDNRARFDLATTDRSLGDDFAAVGDRTRARKAYQDSLQNFDVMLRRDPGNTVVKDHRHDIEIMLRQLDHPMAKQGAPSH
jgi:tetratricopeptide (TPR) repeat protein